MRPIDTVASSVCVSVCL